MEVHRFSFFCTYASALGASGRRGIYGIFCTYSILLTAAFVPHLRDSPPKLKPLPRAGGTTNPVCKLQPHTRSQVFPFAKQPSPSFLLVNVSGLTQSAALPTLTHPVLIPLYLALSLRSQARTQKTHRSPFPHINLHLHLQP